jgi:hypothetical protein
MYRVHRVFPRNYYIILVSNEIDEHLYAGNRVAGYPLSVHKIHHNTSYTPYI